LIKANSENKHLSEVVSKLKSSLNLDVKELRNACQEAVDFFANNYKPVSSEGGGASSNGSPRLDDQPVDDQDTTVDLCLSSDHDDTAKSTHASDVMIRTNDVGNKKDDVISEEEDSAIDAGHSEPLSSATTTAAPTAAATASPPLVTAKLSQPTTASAHQAALIPDEASAKVNEQMRLSLGQEILRIQRESQELQRQQQLRQLQQQRSPQEQQFQAVPLQLSETVSSNSSSLHEAAAAADSSTVSCGPLNETTLSNLGSHQDLHAPPSYEASINNSTLKRTTGGAIVKNGAAVTAYQQQQQRAQLLAQAAGQAVDAKVQEFLHKMRTDKKFQVSLSSSTTNIDQLKKQHMTDSTMNFDTTTESVAGLTESKFRQGLEASLDLSATTTTDND